MTFLDANAPHRRVWPALLSGIALVLVISISIGTIDAFGYRFGFGFFPLIVLAIWPRRANAVLSVILVFLGGLFADWSTGGATGQWSLVYLICWWLLRPELRNEPYAPTKIILIWFVICALAIILLTVSGWFVFGVFPDFWSLLRQAAVATLGLPIILILRSVVVKILSDGDEWGL